ncbi:MAG: insulinase family protein [Magnetococcus sp. YQC-3]
MPPKPASNLSPQPDWTALFRLLSVVALFLWPLNAEGLEHRDFTLDNGLRVILVREPKAPVAISQIWYRVGSVDEEAGKTGLSHMLEHMMFQGTPKVPAGEFHRIIGQNGGENNASTSTDYTNYYIKLASDRIELALRMEADRMRHLTLSEDNFRSENQVVQEERRSRTDADPNARFMEQFQASAYGAHPYGHPVIGWMAEIQQLTVADLRAWYQRYYAPDNAVLVVVGDIDLATIAQQVESHFADIPPRPDRPQTLLPEYQLPDRSKSCSLPVPRLEVTDKAVTLPVWHGAYPVPSLLTAGKEDVFALDLLATILGGGSSSRLHQRLIINEELAVSASAHYGGYGRSWELFSLSAAPKSTPTAAFSTPPEGEKERRRGEHAASVTGKAALPLIEQIILQEIERLTREPVSERELQRAKNSMIAQHIFARDSIHELASVIGLLSSKGLEWQSLVEEYPKLIEAVRAEDIQRVAARYLNPDQLIVGVLQP